MSLYWQKRGSWMLIVNSLLEEFLVCEESNGRELKPTIPKSTNCLI